MNFDNESKILENCDEPTRNCIQKWSQLCEENFYERIPVGLANRREHPLLKDTKGELNTAIPINGNGKKILMILLDNLQPAKFLLITHEIGHCILKFNGFYPSVYKPHPNSNIQILLNSLSEHVPLYKLQKELGHNPQEEIDSRAKHNINLFNKEVESSNKDIWIQNSLILSDDIINCSKNLKIDLSTCIKENHPNTYSYVEKILELKNKFNLIDPRENLKFRQSIINLIDNKKNWKTESEIPKWKKIWEITN